jgi:hypothetical protein
LEKLTESKTEYSAAMNKLVEGKETNYQRRKKKMGAKAKIAS